MIDNDKIDKDKEDKELNKNLNKLNNKVKNENYEVDLYYNKFKRSNKN